MSDHSRDRASAVRVIIVMGVTAAGKTTVGRALADSIGWTFYEGDDFHPRANIERMRAGHPLTDSDRAPWLAALRQLIDRVLTHGEHAVLACSALRHQYRKTLTPAGADRDAVRFVYLDVPKDVLQDRLAHRVGHFMPASLLDSQLATLELPHRAEVVDGTMPVDDIVRTIRRDLSV